MDRAASPVVGTVLLVGVVVALSVAAGAAVTATDRPTTTPPAASLALAVDATADRIAITHEGGEALAVSEIDLTVAVDGRPLAEQPPVPFFAARGFRSGPTGAFNVAGSTTLRVGEMASLRVAGTNNPEIVPGSRVTVTVATDQAVIAELETTARRESAVRPARQGW
ncbi:type IV pilin [Halobacteriales archaeon QH_10_67_13]|nr:MAG: type IV pilin [Halobacteriales archaeon QH_10_67_13]